MRKLLLVNPVGRRSGYLLSNFSKVPPLGLAYVAAATPPHWEVKIADENFDPIELEDADLVGISSFTSTINRAYEISRSYQRKGIKVVLGGIHASMLPDEALKFADAVVVGEAESVWRKVVEDFENGCLSGKYSGPLVDLGKNSIKPKRDLIDSRYFFHCIQTSRGCPFNCDFCSVSRYLGKGHRQRTANDVLAELKEIKGQFIFFLDDNLIGHSRDSRDRAREIFSGMIELDLKKKWWMQTSIDAARDEKTLKLAAEAGCMVAFIGFETTDEIALKRMKKGANLRIGVDNYKKVVKSFHAHGIGVIGSFIIGNDYESPHYYHKLGKFLMNSGIDVVQIAILTPLPGTAFMDEMEKQGRILYSNYPQDWDRYRLSYVVRNTEGVDAKTIYIGNNYLKNHIYSFPRYQYRILKSFFSIRNPINSYAIYRFNKALKKSWLNSQYYHKYPCKFPI